MSDRHHHASSRAAVRSRTDGRTAALPSRVVHHIPGRLRVRFDAPLDPDFYTDLERALEGLPGVDSVRVNASASSAVIHYDPDRRLQWHELQRAEGVQALLADGGYLEFAEAAEAAVARAVIQFEGRSHVAEALVGAAKRLDRQIRVASDGYLDLKTLLPIAAAVFGALDKARAKGTPRWMSLCMFAFEAFTSLHRGQVDGSRGHSMTEVRTIH